jgi:hypothetical protein
MELASHGVATKLGSIALQLLQRVVHVPGLSPRGPHTLWVQSIKHLEKTEMTGLTNEILYCQCKDPYQNFESSAA